MSRETILREYVNYVSDFYDYILIDCTPSLGMITINALACADSVLIPVQAAYLPVKGLEQLIRTIGKVKRQINPKLEIEGILMSMVDTRTNYAKEISQLVMKPMGIISRYLRTVSLIPSGQRRFPQQESAFMSMMEKEKRRLPMKH